jgi:SAM-dependent methyltransferase
VTPPTSSLYDAVAPIYDEWQQWDGMAPFAMVAAVKLAAVLRREARRATRRRPEPFAHLDLGCGTGTTLIELRRRHPDWRLAGIDGSAGMLAAARAKPAAATITWARGRLGDPLPYAAAFDSCSLLYDTLNHLLEPEAISRALATVADVLRPGGLLVFDVTNRDGFGLWWNGRNQFGGDGWELSVAARFDPGGVIGTADVSLARGGAAASFRLTERLYEPDEIRALVERAGFTVVRHQAWAPFARREPGKTWWIARKS